MVQKLNAAQSDSPLKKKYDAVHAAKEAAQAIPDRHKKMNWNKKFDQMMAMHSMTAVNLKRKYNSAKENAVSKSSLSAI